MEKELSSLINRLEKKKEYRVYLRGTPFVIYYMDKFKLKYNKEEVEEKLHYFWIWMKTVDMEMDKDLLIGKEYLNIILGKKSNKKTFGAKLTRKIKSYTRNKNTQIYLKKLYLHTLKERNAKNIEQLIDARKRAGTYIAKIMIELIKPETEKINQKFEEFLYESMQTSQILDSYVDLDEDYKNGEIKFKPTSKDKRKLLLELSKKALKNTPKYPLTIIHAILGLEFLKRLK